VSSRLVLVLGGTRSGKSRYGLERARSLADGAPVTYLATALAGDPELDRRIDRHRRARPADWPTIMVGADLAAAIGSVDAGGTILLDGLTLWLSALSGDGPLDLEAILAGPVAESQAAIQARSGATVIVSDEVGLGIVPANQLAREFRDLIGIVHQQLAAIADEVHLMVAGLPLTLKDG
jgi:adenosylcobinamide kinase/adenosylcobinamide-phosphate guanylyltransferase